MHQSVFHLQQIVTIQERESELSSIISQFIHESSPRLYSYQDDVSEVDVFVAEFESEEHAINAKLLMGLDHLEGTNLASLVIPTHFLY